MRSTVLAIAVLLAATVAVGEELFVPMVGQKQGQDGGWWNTEVWIANPTTSVGSFAIQFLPAGRANGDALRSEPRGEDLGAGTTFYSNEVVPEGQSGVLRVITTSGVVVFARVYNAAGKGSFGQGVAALPRSAATRPGDVAHLLGLRRSAQFRTNLSVFNPGLDNGNVRIRLVGPRGEVAGEESFHLAPGGYLQLDDALHAFNVKAAENLRAEVSGNVPLFATAAVIDTRSGAPTFSAACGN